jgi:hypothetical protein
MLNIRRGVCPPGAGADNDEATTGRHTWLRHRLRHTQAQPQHWTQVITPLTLIRPALGERGQLFLNSEILQFLIKC